MNTTHNENKDHKSMSTNIQSVGKAILLQTAIKWASICFMVWMALSFADVWIKLVLA